eukprot:UN11046
MDTAAALNALDQSQVVEPENRLPRWYRQQGLCLSQNLHISHRQQQRKV